MVKFINAHTGTEMWVSEDRVEEYKAAGHRPVAPFLQPVAKKKGKKK